MSVGENIKRLREQQSLTQTELSEAVGCTQSFIAQVERGSRIPTIVLAKSIADTLHCKIEELCR